MSPNISSSTLMKIDIDCTHFLFLNFKLFTVILLYLVNLSFHVFFGWFYFFVIYSLLFLFSADGILRSKRNHKYARFQHTAGFYPLHFLDLWKRHFFNTQIIKNTSKHNHPGCLFVWDRAQFEIILKIGYTLKCGFSNSTFYSLFQRFGICMCQKEMIY